MNFIKHLLLQFSLIFYLFKTIYCENVTKCNSKTCDERGGICIGDYICECKEDYTTLQSAVNFKFCNYQKKSKLYTALIEFFFGFGIGHFYAERKVNGYFKMIMFFFLCYFSCCAVALGVKIQGDQIRDNQNNTIVKFFFFIYLCILCIMGIWQVFDVFMIGFGFYNDGNDIPLG
jgi:hypothetical protein